MTPLFLHYEEGKRHLEELQEEAARYRTATLIRRYRPRSERPGKNWKIIGLAVPATVVVVAGLLLVF